MTVKPASTPQNRGGYRIGIDTGGTFTDVVVGDATGILSVGKALTTRERECLGRVAERFTLGEGSSNSNPRSG